LIATIVETKELAETVGFATGAGVGLILVYSVAIWGATRFADLSRDHRPLAAGVAAVIAALAFVACLAAVAAGIAVMIEG
jgi:hypothetical protein